MTAITQRLRNAMRALALSLGLAALRVQVLAAACLGGMMMAPGAHAVVICSVAGTHVVQVGADGKPLPVSPDRQINSECPLCVGFHAAAAFTAPAAIALVLPHLWRRDGAFRAVERVAYVRAIFSYDSRGPPAGTFPIAV